MNTKRCRVCGEEKPTNQFHKDNSRKDGLKNICIQCAASQRVEKRHDKIRANMMDDEGFAKIYANKELHRIIHEAAGRYSRQPERHEELAQAGWFRIAMENSTDTNECADAARRGIEAVYRDEYNHPGWYATLLGGE